MPAVQIDGNDVLEVERETKKAVDHIRAGKGPYFIEAITYRFRPHSMFDPELYRDKAEVQEAKKRDPIILFIDFLKSEKLLTDAELAAIEARCCRSCAALSRFCRRIPLGSRRRPDPLCLLRKDPAMSDEPKMIKMNYRDACREGMRAAMHRDEKVFLMGADVGRYGGCFAVSKGMLEEFGTERIRDMPLLESTIAGIGIGVGMGGMRPIVEIMTVNFSLLALDQILNTAATLLHMSGGLFNVPVVIRMATGAGRQLGAQHAHSLEGWYAHIPGIKILAPATIPDAYGMLWPALDGPRPGADLRAAGDVQHAGRSARPGARRGYRPCRRPPPGRPMSQCSPTAPACPSR